MARKSHCSERCLPMLFRLVGGESPKVTNSSTNIFYRVVLSTSVTTRFTMTNFVDPNLTTSVFSYHALSVDADIETLLTAAGTVQNLSLVAVVEPLPLGLTVELTLVRRLQVWYPPEMFKSSRSRSYQSKTSHPTHKRRHRQK